MAEAVGFEPTDARASTVFKTAAFNHSATPPHRIARKSIATISANAQISRYADVEYHAARLQQLAIIRASALARSLRCRLHVLPADRSLSPCGS